MNGPPSYSIRSGFRERLRAGLACSGSVCLIAAGLATAAAPLPAAPLPAAAASPVLDAEFAQLGGATTAVAVESRGQSRLAFVNIGPRVAVYEVSDPEDPARLGQTDLLPEVSEGLAAEGGLLVVGTRRPGADDWYPLDTGPTDGAALHIFDVRDPATPRRLATAPIAALQVGAIVLDRAFAYVLTDTGVAVVDVKNPTNPRQVAELATADPTGRRRPWSPGGLAVMGDHLLVARPEGFFVIDVHEPIRPKLLDTAYLAGPAYGLARLGRWVLVANATAIHVLDLADPAQPRMVHQVTLDTPPAAIAAENDRAVVLIGAGRRLVVLDAADPARLSSIATVPLDPLESEQTALALSGGQVFVALGRAGLRIVDAADPAPPERQIRPREAILPPLEHIDVAGDVIYAAAGAAGVFAVRIEADGNLRLAGALQPELPGPGGVPRRIAFHSVLHHAGLVYAHAEADGLWVIDVRDPEHPVSAGPPLAIAGPRMPHAMARIGDHLYLPAADGTLHVLDLADPSRPLPVGRLSKLGITGVIAGDGVIYATSAGAYGIGHLHVIDATRPSAPRYVRTVDFSVPFNRLAIGLGHLYLTGGFGDLAVLDLTQPAHPFEIDRQKGFDVGRVGVVDRQMIAAHAGWIETVDLASPAFPRRRGLGAALPWGRDDGGIASDVSAVDGRVIVLRHQAGLFNLRSGDIDRSGRPFRPSAAMLFLPRLEAIGAIPTDGDAPAAPPPADPPGSTDPPAPADPPDLPDPRGAPCAVALPAHVTLVIDTSARMAERWGPGPATRITSARAAVGQLAGRLESARTPVTLVSLGRQARRRVSVTEAGDLAAALEAITALPVPPGSPAAIRLDLGFVAAARGLASHAGLSAGPRRVVLLVAGDADAQTWALAAGRAGWLRARLGAVVDVFVLGQPEPAALDRWAHLAGDTARVHPVGDPGALNDQLIRLADGCG